MSGEPHPVCASKIIMLLVRNHRALNVAILPVPMQIDAAIGRAKLIQLLSPRKFPAQSFARKHDALWMRFKHVERAGKRCRRLDQEA